MTVASTHLVQSFLKSFDLPEASATDESARIAAALHCLQEHPGWSQIVDNVDSESATGPDISGLEERGIEFLTPLSEVDPFHCPAGKTLSRGGQETRLLKLSVFVS